MIKILILLILSPFLLLSQVNPSKVIRISDISTVFGSSLSYGTILEVQSTNKIYEIVNVNGIISTDKFTDLVSNTDYIEVGEFLPINVLGSNPTTVTMSGYSSIYTATYSATSTLTFSGGHLIGSRAIFIITSAATSKTITLSGNIKSVGGSIASGASGKITTISFIYYGTNWIEVGRSLGM